MGHHRTVAPFYRVVVAAVSNLLKSFRFCDKKGTVPFLLVLAGCVAEPIVQPLPEEMHHAQTDRIYREVRAVAADGDWIVTRGYHASDHLVANATGLPISHAGVYDRQRDEVIEAESKGVHTSTLRAFIDKSHRVLVIRPRWSTGDRGRIAVAKARELLGASYDYLGTIGFDSPERYYCTELAVEIYAPWRDARERLPRVIKPGELYLWGRVLYDSLPR